MERANLVLNPLGAEPRIVGGLPYVADFGGGDGVDSVTSTSILVVDELREPRPLGAREQPIYS